MFRILALVDAKTPRVFYNRVPKCGSHTMLDLLGALADKNNFTLVRSEQYMTFTLDEDSQVRNFEFNDRLI